MAHDVFICYSSGDRATADGMSLTLESKGIRCWIAPRDILPGTTWGEAIIDAITASQVMVLILSSHANESRQVTREVERAVSKGVPILPFRIEDIPPSKSMEYFISGSQWFEALTPPVEPHLLRLAETLRSLLSHKENYLKSVSDNPRQFGKARVLTEHKRSVSSVAFSPNSEICATGGSDGTVVLWHTRNWEKLGEITRKDRVHSLTFSPNNKQLLILQTNNREVWLWEIESGSLEFSLDNGSTANSASFSPDGKSLAVGSRDHTAKLWDLESESLVDVLDHTYRVQSVAYSSDGGVLAVAGGYEEVRLWDLKTKRYVLAETDSNTNSAHKVIFSPDSLTLVTLRAELKRAELCDAQTGKLKNTFRCPSKLQSGAFSAHGDLLALGAWDATVYLWQV